MYRKAVAKLISLGSVHVEQNSKRGAWRKLPLSFEGNKIFSRLIKVTSSVNV